jgi:hypothetical protein
MPNRSRAYHHDQDQNALQQAQHLPAPQKPAHPAPQAQPPFQYQSYHFQGTYAHQHQAQPHHQHANQAQHQREAHTHSNTHSPSPPNSSWHPNHNPDITYASQDGIAYPNSYTASWVAQNAYHNGHAQPQPHPQPQPQPQYEAQHEAQVKTEYVERNYAYEYDTDDHDAANATIQVAPSATKTKAMPKTPGGRKRAAPKTPASAAKAAASASAPHTPSPRRFFLNADMAAELLDLVLDEGLKRGDMAAVAAEVSLCCCCVQWCARCG